MRSAPSELYLIRETPHPSPTETRRPLPCLAEQLLWAGDRIKPRTLFPTLAYELPSASLILLLYQRAQRPKSLCRRIASAVAGRRRASAVAGGTAPRAPSPK